MYYIMNIANRKTIFEFSKDDMDTASDSRYYIDNSTVIFTELKNSYEVGDEVELEWVGMMDIIDDRYGLIGRLFGDK